jgi:hypothetical protein
LLAVDDPCGLGFAVAREGDGEVSGDAEFIVRLAFAADGAELYARG